MENGTKAAEGKSIQTGNLDNMDGSKLSSGFMITSKMIHDIEVPPEKPNKEYYDEYCKSFIINYILTEQLNTLRRENKDLNEKYKTLEKSSGSTGGGGRPQGSVNDDQGDEPDKKRRKRKKKDEVERNFKCPSEGCAKAYGSENSLNQHLKLKHMEFWEQLKNEGAKSELEGSLKEAE